MGPVECSPPTVGPDPQEHPGAPPGVAQPEHGPVVYLPGSPGHTVVGCIYTGSIVQSQEYPGYQLGINKGP